MPAPSAIGNDLVEQGMATARYNTTTASVKEDRT
jgi:hypothetical protein